MTTQTEVWLLFFATAILTGLVTMFLGYGIWFVRDRFKNWVIINDENGGTAQVLRAKTAGGKLLAKNRAGEPKAFILNAKSRKTTKRGGLYIVDDETGFNLIGPDRNTIQEWIKAGHVTAKAMICDPEHTFHVLKSNVWQDYLRAKEDKPHWMVALAPIILIAFIFAIGVIGFMAWKLSERGA